MSPQPARKGASAPTARVMLAHGKLISSFGTKGSGPGQFDQPRGIAVDKNGVVYVSDSRNNRLQLF